MYIEFTGKQYFFILHALAVMITFYNNDFSSICKEVGETYGASEENIASACAMLTAVNVTVPIKSLSDKCSDILEDVLHHARELPEKDAPYMDIAANYDYGKLRLLRLQAYHDARWNGVGVIEARDLLIPQLKKMGIGWNGNFGISNSELAYNSKLAYEILKAIRYVTESRDSSVLKVTDEPLPHVEGSFQIKAL